MSPLLRIICLDHNIIHFCQFKSEAGNKSMCRHETTVTFQVRIQEKLWQLQVDETDMNNWLDINGETDFN